MIIDTDWETGLEIQEQNLNIKMNTLTRASQAGRNNLPVKVVRTPFLRKSDCAPEFQKIHLPTAKAPEASGEKTKGALLCDGIHYRYFKSSTVI